MRRRPILAGLWATAFVTVAALLVLVPPSTMPLLGSREERAAVIQTILTGVALLAAAFAIYLGLGAAPRIRVRIVVDAGMMRLHHLVTVTAVGEAISSLRVELRFKPPAESRRLGHHPLDRDAAPNWVAAVELVRGAPTEQRILGWDLEKARLEPLEETPQLYFTLAAHGVFDPPLPLGDARVLEIRWWSSQTGPTTVEIPLPLDTGMHTFDSRGS
ncbi:MAG: hypothetical protein KC458_10130 [Dehalococcoidia bacterium]|nr:hypothetical protein [Dehalococcoidia bacterium]